MRDEAAALLQKLWRKSALGKVSPPIPSELLAAVDRSVNCPIKSYRYVLPTQLLAKAVQPELDCRSIQEGAELPNSFDARSLCHEVIVPFDRVNHSVLGGSSEPYVNNPLRIPSITTEFRRAQKNKVAFDDLCSVLQYAQEHPTQVRALLISVLIAIRKRLEITHVVYPVPGRISFAQSLSLLHDFLDERTGGLRLQAIAVALLRVLGKAMNLFESVKSAPVNAADASTGLAADLSCLDEEGRVVLAVEVKDRKLTLRQVQDKLPIVRERGIKELLFLVQGGIEKRDKKKVSTLIEREFGVGQNIYVGEFVEFFKTCLVVLGEEGRRVLFSEIGTCLDEFRADISHRQTWAQLLAQV